MLKNNVVFKQAPDAPISSRQKKFDNIMQTIKESIENDMMWDSGHILIPYHRIDNEFESIKHHLSESGWSSEHINNHIRIWANWDMDNKYRYSLVDGGYYTGPQSICGTYTGNGRVKDEGEQ